jgi:hypothetical protein
MLVLGAEAYIRELSDAEFDALVRRARPPEIRPVRRTRKRSDDIGGSASGRQGN